MSFTINDRKEEESLVGTFSAIIDILLAEPLIVPSKRSCVIITTQLIGGAGTAHTYLALPR